MNDNETREPGTGVIQLRLICIETRTSNPGDVTAIARTEMEIDGGDYRIDTVQVQQFGGTRSVCTRQELATAVNDPVPADLLACHDAARTLELMPPALTGTVPWIATGRLLLQAYPGAPTVDLEASVGWLGLTPVLDAMTSGGPGIARRCAALALVAHHVVGRLGLARAITFSTYQTRPLGPAPTIDDDDGWAAMPRDDLWWLATFAENAKRAGLVPERVLDPVTGDRALREYNRRRIWAAGQA